MRRVMTRSRALERARMHELWRDLASLWDDHPITMFLLHTFGCLVLGACLQTIFNIFPEPSR